MYRNLDSIALLFIFWTTNPSRELVSRACCQSENEHKKKGNLLEPSGEPVCAMESVRTEPRGRKPNFYF